jgi:hypothetical protein
MKVPFFFAAVWSIALALSATAAPKKSPPPPSDSSTPPQKKEEPKKTTYTVAGEVTAVNAYSLNLKAEGQPEFNFAFTENTKILNGDKPANLADLKVGKKVGALAKKARGGDQLLIVNLNGKEPLEKKEPEKDKKPVATDKTKPKKKTTSSSNKDSSQ